MKRHRRKRLNDGVFLAKCLWYEFTSVQRDCVARISDKGTVPITREHVVCIESKRERTTVSMFDQKSQSVTRACLGTDLLFLSPARVCGFIFSRMRFDP